MTKAPARRETTSWWRIVPAIIWGGVAGSVAVPFVSLGADSATYNAHSNAYAALGLVAGLLLYLGQRALKMNVTSSAFMLSGMRSAGVFLVLCVFAWPGSGEAMGRALGGFVLGIIFYGIERGIGKIMPVAIGGTPPRDPEATYRLDRAELCERGTRGASRPVRQVLSRAPFRRSPTGAGSPGPASLHA